MAEVIGQVDLFVRKDSPANATGPEYVVEGRFENRGLAPPVDEIADEGRRRTVWTACDQQRSEMRRRGPLLGVEPRGIHGRHDYRAHDASFPIHSADQLDCCEEREQG